MDRNKVVDVGYLLASYIAKDTPGEDFHKDYKKHKEVFLRIVKTDTKLERELRKYFKGLAERIPDRINWLNYKRQVQTAAVSDLIEADWDGEELILRVILTDALQDAIMAGGMLTELETGIPVGFSNKSPRALEFIRKHSLKLAKGLNDTTRDKVRQSLLTSLGNGEDQSTAAKALAEILDDPRRAEMIAHTESVNAFSAGRLEVAEEVGADRKEWSATLDPCPICEALDGEIVELDDNFSGGDESPPAHPNCRCLVRILMPGE